MEPLLVVPHYLWGGGDLVEREMDKYIFSHSKQALVDWESLYCHCSHSELSFVDERSKNWLSPKSQAFEALQSIVFDKTILKDKVHVTATRLEPRTTYFLNEHPIIWPNWSSGSDRVGIHSETRMWHDKNIQSEKVHLTQLWHTGVLEVYHSLRNKWAPKSIHFSYKGMVAQS